DGFVDLPGAEHFGTERLMRLPDGAWCFTPLSGSPSVAESPAMKTGGVTFGSFNNLAKVNESVLDIWARVLDRVPASRLALKSVAFRSPEVVDRFSRSFERRGIAAERIELRPDERAQLDHLRQYDRVDIALDTFAYPGMTTTCEALWM